MFVLSEYITHVYVVDATPEVLLPSTPEVVPSPDNVQLVPTESFIRTTNSWTDHQFIQSTIEQGRWRPKNIKGSLIIHNSVIKFVSFCTKVALYAS